MPPGLYLHIPFCRKKCGYCSFPSLADPPEKLVERYVEALLREIDITARSVRHAFGSVYLGGGTPTLLAETQISRILRGVRSRVRIVPGAEITVEANPCTITPSLAHRLRRLGVTRVSLGVQSFRDVHLRTLGRLHTSAASRTSLSHLAAAGIANVSIDLIYGIPDQSLEDWLEELDEAVAAEPQHLSLYALTVEEGTVFADRRRQGRLPLPPEEDVAMMYRHALRRLAAEGYEHYEISNWAKPGFRSRHNESCWRMEPYTGAGAGAHGYDPGPPARRTVNVADVGEYVRRLEEGRTPVAERTVLTLEDVAAESLMLGLRLREGVSRRRFYGDHGGEPEDFLREGAALAYGKGWLERDGDWVRLTEEGILFSDEIFVHLF